MGFSRYLENLLLNKILRNEDFTIPSVYLSLHSDYPGKTGEHEISGEGYARQVAAFDWASVLDGAARNREMISFDNMPAVVVSHAGAWDASSGGNFLFGGVLYSDAIGKIPSGAYVQIKAGEIVVSLD